MEQENRGLLPAQQLSLTYKPHVFSQTCVTHLIQPGTTIAEATQSLSYPKEFEDLLRVYVDNKFIPQELWHKTALQHNQIIFIIFVPGKGGEDSKNPLAFVASVALLAFAPVVGTKLAGYLGITHSVGVSLITAGFTMIGTQVINSVFPPPAANFQQLAGRDAPESQNYRADAARNKLEIESPVISLYGKHRMFPNYAAAPFTVMSGDIQYIYMLFDAGYGKVDITDQKFGETQALSAYQELEVKIHKEFTAGDRLSFFTKDVFTDAISLEVGKESPRIITTQSDCNEAQVDLLFTRGLTTFDNSGNRAKRKIRIKMNYRAVGSSTWVPANAAQKVSYTNDEIVSVAGRFDAEMIINSFSQNVDTTLLVKASIKSISSNRQTIQVQYNRYDSFFTPDDFLVVNNVKYLLLNDETFQGYAQGNYWYQSFNIAKALPTYVRVGQSVNFERKNNWGDNGQSSFNVLSPNYAPKKGDKIHVNGAAYAIQSVSNAGTKTYNITITTPINFNLEADRSEYNRSYSAAFGQNRTGAYVQYKKVELRDQNAYKTAIDIERATAQSFTLGVNIEFAQAGQYEIQVIRETDDATSDRVFDTFTIAQLRSLQFVSPITPDKPRTLIEMKVKVNEQLNGLIEDYNFVGQRHLKVGDGLGNYALQATRNPAWIALDILTGDIAPRPLPFSRINHQSFKDFADWCDQLNVDGEAKFMCDFVMDFQSTVRQLVNQVVAVGRGVLIQVDGVFQIAIDRPKDTPKQLFTPRNTNGFAGTRSYPDRKDYIKTRFVDAESNYKLRNYKIYDDGKNENNSTTFENFDAFGVTRARQAFEQTRYAMAQSIARSTTYSFLADVEYLTCKRGDLVLLQNDVPRAGGLPARITNITKIENNVENVWPKTAYTIVEFDRDIISQSISQYDLFIRQSDGRIQQISGMELVAGNANALQSPLRYLKKVNRNYVTTFVDSEDPFVGVEIGDLIVYGEPDSTVRKCLVKEIIPQDTLSAEIVLTDYGPDIFEADTGDMPEYNPQFSSTEVNAAAPKPVINVVANQEISHKDRFPVVTISINWNVDGNESYPATFEVYKLNDENQYELVDTVTKAPYTYTQSARVDQTAVFGAQQTFKILPVSHTGNKLSLNKIQAFSFTPQKDNVAPAPVSNFRFKINNNLLYAMWDNPSDVDFDGVTLRRGAEGKWEVGETIALLNHTQNSVQIDPLETFFMIKTKDTSGNESAVIKKYYTYPKIEVIDSSVKINADGIVVNFNLNLGYQLKSIKAYLDEGLDVLAESKTNSVEILGAADTTVNGALRFRFEIFDTNNVRTVFYLEDVNIISEQIFYDFGNLLIAEDWGTSYHDPEKHVAAEVLRNLSDPNIRNYDLYSVETPSSPQYSGTIQARMDLRALPINQLLYVENFYPTRLKNSINSISGHFGTLQNWNDGTDTESEQNNAIVTNIKNTDVIVINPEKHTSIQSLINENKPLPRYLGKMARFLFTVEYGLKRMSRLLLTIKRPTLSMAGTPPPPPHYELWQSYPSYQDLRIYVIAYTKVTKGSNFEQGTLGGNRTSSGIDNNYYYKDLMYGGEQRYFLFNDSVLIKDAHAFEIVCDVVNTYPGGVPHNDNTYYSGMQITFPIDFLNVKAAYGSAIGEVDVAATGETEVVFDKTFYDPQSTSSKFQWVNGNGSFVPDYEEPYEIRPQIGMVSHPSGYAEITSQTEQRFKVKLFDSTGTQVAGKIRYEKSGIILSNTIDVADEQSR